MKTFTKQSLTKRMLAIILSLLFAVSSFTIAGFVPTMEAQAETANIDLTRSYVGITAADASRYSGSGQTATLNIVNDQQDSNFSIGYVNIDISAYDGKVFSSFPLTFGRASTSNSDSQGIKFWYTGNTNGDSLTSNSRVDNASDIKGSDDGHLTRAIDYYNLSAIASYTKDEFNGSTFPVTIDVAAAANATLERGGTRLVIMITQPQSGGKAETQRTGNRGSDGWTDTKVTFNKSQTCTVSYQDAAVDPNAIYEYDFDFSKATLDSPGTGAAKTMINSANNNKLQYVYWSNAQITPGQYIRANDITIATQSDISPKIKGEHWIASVNFKAQTLQTANKKAIALGVGSTSDLADLCYVSYDGHITFNNQKTNAFSANASGFDFTSWDDKVITLYIEYINGVVKAYYTVGDDTTKIALHSIDISSNQTLNDKFKNGIGGLFIGSTKKRSGSWDSDTYSEDYTAKAGVKTESGDFVYFYNLHANNIINELYPVDPDEPDTPSVDTSSIESAMTAFENKVKDGRIYTNIAAAYTAYVNCQKGLDAAKYGHDTSIDVSALASALTTATNNMQVWSAPVYKNDQKFSTASSSDNGYSNAIWVQSSNERCFTGVKANGWWFNFFCHDAVYVYDGVTTPTIPVMAILQTQATYTKYAIGVYPAGAMTSGLALQGLWHGVHTNNRSFSDAWAGGIRVNNAYAQNGLNYLYETSGQNTYNYYIANKINIDGATLFGNSTLEFYKQVNINNTWKLHDGTSLSNDWQESCTNVNPTLYVLNYKPVLDKAKEKTNLFNNIVNYSEGGLSCAAEALNNMPNIGFASTTTSNVSTTANNLSTAYNNYGYASSNDKTDSTDYAALRTALDNCDVLNNNDCRANYKAYADARAVARAAMKQVNSAGYLTTYNSKSIATIAEDLKNAIKDLGDENTGGHLYSNFGTLNKDTMEIVYTCARDESHTYEIDATTFMAAVETLGAEVSKDYKYTEGSREAADEILKKNSFTDEEGSESDFIKVKVSKDDIVDTLNTYTTNLLSALNTTLVKNTFEVTVNYEKNSDLLKSVTKNYSYGDVITEIPDGVSLAENEAVYKWSVELEGSSPIKYNNNRSLSPNYTVVKPVTLTCYIDKGTDTTNSHKVTYYDKSGKVSGIRYFKDGTKLTVIGNELHSADGVEFYADQVPFYSVTGFRVGGNIYEGNTEKNIITVNNDIDIYASYTPFKQKFIITTGEGAGNALINSKNRESSGEYLYEARYDEKITITDSKIKNWYLNGKFFARGMVFSFRACCNAVITAKDVVPSTDTNGFVNIDYFEYRQAENKVSLVISFAAFQYDNYGEDAKQYHNIIPDEAGVYLSTSASTPEAIKLAGKKFAASSFTDSNNQAKISVSRTANTKFTMYALPYVVINGVEVLGEVKTCSYNPTNL